MQLSPSIGGAVGRAAAHAEVRGAEAGLALLDQIDLQTVISYQPYWAVRAHFLQQLGRTQAAAEAYDRAISLSDNAAVRAFLHRPKSRLRPRLAPFTPRGRAVCCRGAATAAAFEESP